MNKFWEWMKKKYYFPDHFEIPNEGIVDFDKQPQMLIGYMMEYLESVMGMIEAEFAFKNMSNDTGSTEERYNWLESKINSLEEV